MKALKSKLLLSITTLIVAIVAVAGSAYAWFTLSNTATASVEITVTSGDGLQISDSASGIYSSALNITDDVTLSAATTQDGSSFQTITVGGTLGNQYTMGAATAGSHYFQKTLYFRTPVKPASSGQDYLQLDTTNSFATQSGSPAVYASHAVRASFNNGTVAPIWEPNKALGNKSYGDTNTGTPEIDNAAWTYFVGVAGAANVTAVSDYLTANPTQTTNNATALAQLSDVNGWATGTGTNAGYYVSSIVVNIWLEGFDADTFDAIFSQVFNVGLVFIKG